MKLISPAFLEETSANIWCRERVLLSLFEDKDIFSIVMKIKNITFDEACELISKICYEKEAPEATESEKIIMQRVAKEFVDEWKK
jgi:aspartyl/asparaginyl-tRNA synthetase